MKINESYKLILKNWLYGIAFYLIPFIIGYLAFSFVLSDNVLHTDVDSARYMLSALIQSEAAIMALVVTLSLVAVQLAAQSYSARVIEVFRKAPDLWILMGIYGIAIFYGLGVLKMIENPLVGRQSNLEEHIVFSYCLGVFAFVALGPYIWKMFEMLKPSTVINMLAEGITKEKILDSIPERQEKPNDKDPVQPIIDIVRGSLMKYDYETVRDGLRAIGKQTIDIIRKETFNENELEKISHFIFSHLTRIGKLAASRKDEESVSEVITTLYNVSIFMVEQKLEKTACKAIFSLGMIGEIAAEQIFESATWDSIDFLREIGETAAKKELKDSTQEVAEKLGSIGEIARETEFKLLALFSLEIIGKAALEHKLKNAVLSAIFSLEKIGKSPTKNEFVMFKAAGSLNP
ncbi:MAG: hypothetical protein MPEBLZ_02006 [Candidatus Methanoperedens nitroreducens]|uniref:DUF2254 domain-containing protein n=1 Tax=Candidatus Methanoperedens nitratireducens TaxID=1392998 RepID=A0A0P8CK89_9EURY|nr:DUF2254 family protein [Candidatus Methanoperedens sp. BLZ2]KAB2941034.1 MAG: DUF2254 domain-containing protein [Candidatus Methanoperedens sp.]KPQ43447.1 MAG: hypothetical protein MPEBLZ_02006 [Candidatus Methanoperedens sp. BLZ1]MBZ0174984.1 DUF2254 domain-containing protein [Candidatus Methanoperedens nitroreducens]MCX9079545.1 DUF2254 domain-containing protein [Candidatus Methanoperedens sp.]